MAARYQTTEELAAGLRGWPGGNFGKGDAADRSKELKKAAGEVVVDMGLKRSDDTATA